MREMKESGVDWIAHIPTDWTTNKMKYLFSNGKGLSITKENLIEAGLPVISYGQIHSKDNSGTDIKDTLLRYVDFQYQANNPQCEVFQHDFVFADTSEDYDGCGNCVYKRDTSLLFGGYHAIIMHSLIKHDNRFFAYLFKTDAWRKQLREAASGVKVFSITQKALMNCSIIIPPEDEQKEISDFLDAKCSELDTAVSDIQSQIETLEEYKRSVITEAVTKGLDPDVEMRDSGVQWIGDMPAHWSTMPNKYVMRKVKKICPKYNGEQILSLTMNGVIIRDLDAGGKMPTTFDGYQYVEPDNLLMCLFDIDVTPRCIGLIKDFGLTSPAYSQFIMSDNAFAPYYVYYYTMIDNDKTLLHLAKNLRHSLTEEQLGAISVIVPPYEEQKEIADYLDSKIAEIDSIIALKKQQIETIEEYKKSLIFEYVTGKKEVGV